MVPWKLIALVSLAMTALSGLAVPSHSIAGGAAPSLDPTPSIRRGEEASAWLRSHGLYDRVQATGLARRYEVRSSSIRTAVTGAALEAANPSQGFRAGFGAAGVEVRPSDVAAHDWLWSMQFTAIARGDRRTAVGPATVTGSGDRVEYRHAAGLTEWYVNRPGGIEHGFTIEAAPHEGASGALELVLAVTGDLAPRLSPAGDLIQFVSADGRAVLGYRDLHAWDASGRALPSRMGVASGDVRLVVDDRGAQYPITVDPIVYSVSLLVPTGGGVDDEFGWSVAISGTTAVVGAPSRGTEIFPGAAFVFVLSGGTWQQQAELRPSDGQNLDGFGAAVAISGNTIVVGAPGANVVVPNDGPEDDEEVVDAGAAYVFVRSGASWPERAKLTANPPAADDAFGYAVSINGDTIVVGAPNHDPGETPLAGAVYVFKGSGSTWTQQAKLLGASMANRQAGDAFGFSVALTNGPGTNKTLVAGAPFFHGGTPGPPVGRASVFVGSGAAWSREANLVPSDGLAGDAFGFGVGISGDTVVIGAPGHVVGGKDNAGQAYVFARSGAVWSEQAKLAASDGLSGDQFGGAVDVDGSTIVVGAPVYRCPTAEECQAEGRVYVFMKDDQGWKERAKLKATQAAPLQYFGFSVAISGDTIVASAPFHGPLGPGEGASAGPAYVFTPSPLVTKVWIGLKNSDAIGLRLDLRVEVSQDGVRTFEGVAEDVTSGSSGINNAKLHTISLGETTGSPPAQGGCAGTEGLCLRVAVRVSCSGVGHDNGIPRLWYNNKAADSRLEVGERLYLRRVLNQLRLRDDLGLLRLSIDRPVNDDTHCPNRPFAEFGAWKD